MKRGHDLIGISFVLGTFHRMKEQVELIRKYSPRSQIVLGGYGTVLPDDLLLPLADSICREEGVGFMRRLLGQPELAMPYSHPSIVNPLTVFGRNVSRTGVVFGGLGCPNGCDFCCTSHFFRRKHVRLLPTGADIYAVIQQYMNSNSEMLCRKATGFDPWFCSRIFPSPAYPWDSFRLGADLDTPIVEVGD